MGIVLSGERSAVELAKQNTFLVAYPEQSTGPRDRATFLAKSAQQPVGVPEVEPGSLASGGRRSAVGGRRSAVGHDPGVSLRSLYSIFRQVLGLGLLT
jgi:hypothetical protein